MQKMVTPVKGLLTPRLRTTALGNVSALNNIWLSQIGFDRFEKLKEDMNEVGWAGRWSWI